MYRTRRMSDLPGPSEERQLPRPPIPWWNLNSVLLLIIAVVAGRTMLRLMGGIFVPLVIALLLSFVFSPLVTGLVKIHIPRFLAITVVLVLFLAASFLLGLIL